MKGEKEALLFMPEMVFWFCNLLTYRKWKWIYPYHVRQEPGSVWILSIESEKSLSGWYFFLLPIPASLGQALLVLSQLQQWCTPQSTGFLSILCTTVSPAPRMLAEQSPTRSGSPLSTAVPLPLRFLSWHEVTLLLKTLPIQGRVPAPKWEKRGLSESGPHLPTRITSSRHATRLQGTSKSSQFSAFFCFSALISVLPSAQNVWLHVCPGKYPPDSSTSGWDRWPV